MDKQDIVWRLHAATPYGLEDQTLLTDAAQEIQRLNNALLLAGGLLSTYEPWSTMHPTVVHDMLTRIVKADEARRG